MRPPQLCMSEEPEHAHLYAHTTYNIIARAIKPDRVYEPVFQKEEKRGRFINRPQTRSFGACLSKKKIKGLNTTYHVQYYTVM